MTRAYRPGPRNLITDVAGLTVGNAADEASRSGVTVLLAERLTTASVDVRGGGPGTRDTEALAPENLVGGLDALVLSGGSALGLAAADGVAQTLSAKGRGVEIAPGHPTVPITPTAIIYDLTSDTSAAWDAAGGPPHRRLGAQALEAAAPDFALGANGAGRGARAGALKGGLGSASLDLGGGVIVGALVAANPVGSVVMPGTHVFWAWPWEIDGEFGGARPAPDAPPVTAPIPPDAKLGGWTPGANTAIGAVATTARLTTAECKRVAMMAHDGFARAIRPAHTPFDGDTIFAIATGAAETPADGAARGALIATIGAAAADCMARAVARGVYAAISGPDEAQAWRNLA